MDSRGSGRSELVAAEPKTGKTTARATSGPPRRLRIYIFRFADSALDSGAIERKIAATEAAGGPPRRMRITP